MSYRYKEEYKVYGVEEGLRVIGYDNLKTYFNSPHWRIIQEEVLGRDSWACRNCGRLALDIGLMCYTPGTLSGFSPGLIFSLCRSCVNFCLQKTSDGTPDFEILRKRVRMLVLKLKGANWRAGAAISGKWYKEQFQSSELTSRRILSRIESELPDLARSLLQKLESGELPEGLKPYLGIQNEQESVLVPAGSSRKNSRRAPKASKGN